MPINPFIYPREYPQYKPPRKIIYQPPIRVGGANILPFPTRPLIESKFGSTPILLGPPETDHECSCPQGSGVAYKDSSGNCKCDSVHWGYDQKIDVKPKNIICPTFRQNGYHWEIINGGCQMVPDYSNPLNDVNNPKVLPAPVDTVLQTIMPTPLTDLTAGLSAHKGALIAGGLILALLAFGGKK